MARPALSATRGIDVIDFLAAFPARAFSLSEIARATGVNVASCHAVLTALVARGYLTRADDRRTYRLGPALAAVGEAALVGQPLLARARDAAAALHAELGVPAMLTTVLGADIVCVGAAYARDGADPGMKVGERLPLVPPVGVPFLAWAGEADVDEWIARHDPPADPATVALWRRSLEMTRARGFQVTLRSTDDRTIARLMADLASGREIHGYRDAVTRLFSAIDPEMAQPRSIEDARRYDIVLIAAPIFAATGRVAYSLCLGGFAGPIAGAEITGLAERLVQTCLRVVREDRGGA